MSASVTTMDSNRLAGNNAGATNVQQAVIHSRRFARPQKSSEFLRRYGFVAVEKSAQRCIRAWRSSR
jgi:hypothetical protein